MSKYRAKKTEVDGIVFHSKKEANRWQDLKLLERAGEISSLERQVKFTLIPSQRIGGRVVERPVKYSADFVYVQDGKTVTEDCKGVKTPDYIIKRKLMLYVHGIKILET